MASISLTPSTACLICEPHSSIDWRHVAAKALGVTFSMRSEGKSVVGGVLPMRWKKLHM